MACSHCNGTGDTGSGYLDCVYCDAAEIIAAHEARKKFIAPATELKPIGVLMKLEGDDRMKLYGINDGEPLPEVAPSSVRDCGECKQMQMDGFIKVMRKVIADRDAALATAPVQPQWISVKDRLPEELDDVLISGFVYDDPKNDRYMAVSMRIGDYWSRGSGGDYYHPTHWMELPASPVATPEKPE